MEQSDKIPRAAAAAIIFLYGVLSLFRLGLPYAPSTFWESKEKANEIFLDFGEEKEFGSLVFYLGNYENRRFALQVGLGDPIVWEDLPEITMKRVYQWGTVPVKAKGRFLKLTTVNQFSEIRELIVKDVHGKELIPANRSKYPRLFDESWMYPGYGSFQTGTVFDEAVFARTAYEHLHGLRAYEDTHPPLGKLLIAPGIALFGMNPFGWRVMGVLAGVLLLAVLWAFAAALFRDAWVSVGVVALFALDFLHFTQSRLGQVDAFLVLFMTGMDYFMFRYCQAAVKGEGGRSWPYLFGSGACLGLSVSCKWSGLYGGAGLALMWFSVLVCQKRQGKMTGRSVRSLFGVSCLAFVAVPLTIYLLSYIPYIAFDETMGFWERMGKNQINMFQYHSHMSPVHESASRWFQWPVIGKPVKLFGLWFGGGDVERLVLMGNPAFWWPGLAMLISCLWDMAEKTERKFAFLLTAYLAPMLPWIGISRSSFLYHYYPCLPFLALIMGYWAEKKGKRGRYCLWACVGASALLFLLFYPVISGLRVPAAYVEKWLEWLPSWQFAS